MRPRPGETVPAYLSGEGKAHALLADVDRPLTPDLLMLAARVAGDHGLPPVALYESSPGHTHAISLCSRSVAEVASVMGLLGCDVDHVTAGARRGHWLLRR